MFTVPANQAFVYVIPAADKDPVGTLLDQLRSNCILSEQEATVPVSGPRRYQQIRRSARQATCGGDLIGSLGGSQLVDCSLKEFLWQHVDLVLTKKGFDDSVGRNPQPSHFELPTYVRWVQVASKLFQVLITNTDEELAELAAKVQSQAKVLDSFLDADTKFSENRCQKALPLAHSAYQSNLPHNYTTTVHKNQLAQALRVYSQHARGVAFQRYALQLHEDCYKFWSNGHQLCEERSLTDQHCVHKFHLLPRPGERLVLSSAHVHGVTLNILLESLKLQDRRRFTTKQQSLCDFCRREAGLGSQPTHHEPQQQGALHQLL